MTGTSVVPFGKYKGKPAEALREDKQYCDWLVAQDWFRSRYNNLFTIIINNFGEPSSTPEHNALQALFLNEKFCAKIFDRCRPTIRRQWAIQCAECEVQTAQGNVNCKSRQTELEAVLHKVEGWEPAARERHLKYLRDQIALLPEAQADLESALQLRSDLNDDEKYMEWLCEYDVEVGFEIDGADVVLSLGGNWSVLRIEIKPMVADDFPAVLREMKANKCNILFVGNYTGLGASREQFVAIFQSSGISVLFHDGVDSEPTGGIAVGT